MAPPIPKNLILPPKVLLSFMPISRYSSPGMFSLSHDRNLLLFTVGITLLL